MKKFRTLLSIAVALTVVAFTAPLFGQSDSKTGEDSKTSSKDQEAAAIVNGVKIPKTAFEKELEGLIEQQTMQNKKPDDKEIARLKQMVLDRLINKETLYQESVKQGIKVEESEIDAQIENLRSRFATDAEYNEYLKKMNLTADSLRKRIKQTLSIRKFINDEFQKKTSVSEEDAKSFYESHPEIFRQNNQVHAAHILIKSDPDAESDEKTEALKKIKDIKKQLDEGADFGKLAEKHSEGPSGPKGGDLGFFGRGQMVKPFEEVAFSMEAGEISDVVETRFGYHIIKVIEKKEGSTIEYDTVKQRIIQNLEREKVEKKVFDYLEELKKKADIKTFI